MSDSSGIMAYLYLPVPLPVSPGVVSMPSTVARRAPGRPSLVSTEMDHQGFKRQCLPSWGASSLENSFGDGRGNLVAVADLHRFNKEAKSSEAHSILGKVRGCILSLVIKLYK